jgi:hypothetical protein
MVETVVTLRKMCQLFVCFQLVDEVLKVSTAGRKHHGTYFQLPREKDPMVMGALAPDNT